MFNGERQTSTNLCSKSRSIVDRDSHQQRLLLTEMVTLALGDRGSIFNLRVLLMTDCEREIAQLDSTFFDLDVVLGLILLDSSQQTHNSTTSQLQLNSDQIFIGQLK